MAYTPYYPGGWLDLPNTTTPIKAAALQNIENGLVAATGFANPMTIAGDVIYGGSGGLATRLGIGTAGQVLTVTGGIPAWANASSGFADPETTAGDIIIRNASNVTTRLGTSGAPAGAILSLQGATPVPTWTAPPTPGSGSTAWFNVKTAGNPGGTALGNGVNNDYPAIQGALNQCSSNGGGVVYLPKGTYYCNSNSALVVFSNTMLIGDGGGVATALGGSVINFVSTTTANACVAFGTGTANGTIRDIGIFCNQNTNSGISGSTHGVLVQGGNPSWHRIQNVSVLAVGGSGFYLGGGSGGQANTTCFIDNCYTYACGVSGVYSANYSTDSIISNTIVANSYSHGFQFNGDGGSGTMHVISCKSYWNGWRTGGTQTNAADFHGGSGYYLAAGQRGIWLTNCEAQNNGTNGFEFNGNGGVIDYCVVQGCTSWGDNESATSSAGFKFYNTQYSTIVGCVGYLPGADTGAGSGVTYGLVLYGNLVGTTIANCHFEGNSGACYRDATVSGAFQLRNIDGLSPIGPLTSTVFGGTNITAPSVPASTTPLTNPAPADAYVCITAAAGGTSTVALGGTTAGVIPASGVCGFQVAWNQTITLTYGGGNAPTWKWFIN